MHASAVSILLLGQLIMCGAALAQQASAESHSATAFCDFDDEKEISVRYSNAPATAKDEPHNGKVWLPGGSAMTLFTTAPVTLNNTAIAVGAYSMYVIPNRKEWTLIVNKNVTPDSAYDEKQDVARASMELGEVESPPKQLAVSFAHTASKVCSIRLYYEKTGAFVDFHQQ